MPGLTCTSHQLEDLSGPLVQDLEVMSLNKVVQMHDTVNARQIEGGLGATFIHSEHLKKTNM